MIAKQKALLSSCASVNDPLVPTATEIGAIPSDWCVFSLGELFDCLGTASNSRADLGDVGEIAYVHYGDIHTRFDHFIDFSRTDVPRLLPGRNVTAARLRDGDLIVADASEDEAGVGKSVEVRNLGATEAVSGLHTLLLRPKDQRVQVGYRGYLQENALVKAQLRRLATGLKVFGISKRALKDVCVPLPPPAEQSAIAAALSDVDELLEALEKLIAKKRAIKQAAMQQLLTGKTRLWGFSGEWETKRLGEVGEVSGAGVDKKVRPNEQPVRLVNYLDVYWKRFLYSKDLMHEVTARPEQARRCTVQKGDIFFTPTSEVRDDIGHSAVAMEDVADGAYSYHVVRLRLRTDWDLTFRGYVFDTKAFYDQATTVCEGSGTRYVITLPKFRAMTVSFPATVGEQQAIATLLSDMDAEIAALERRRDKTRAIKQGMMQQLLTGRIRLIRPAPVAEAESASKVAVAHSWAFNEAVVISVLIKRFGREQYPLGRKRYTKLAYLLHRHVERQVAGYLRKAAGPYNPKTRYGGPEKIAVQNGYVREHKRGKFQGFVAAENIAQAEGYFEKWYGLECGQWLEQFRRETNDKLELLTTVDMAVEELRAGQKDVEVWSVKDVIRSHPEWKAKLDRLVFSDASIAQAIDTCRELFG